MGALLAGACVGGLWVPAAAVADTCPIEVLVDCPGAGTPEPNPSPTTTTAVASPTTTSTTAPALTSAQAAARLVALLNGERRRAGLVPFMTRGDVAQIASSWSAAMARSAHLSHNDAYFTKQNRRQLDARVLGENVARNRDIDAAHRALMASAAHRANILDSRFLVVGVGAELSNGSWWVTEDFLQPRSRGASSEAPRAGTTKGAAAPRSSTETLDAGPSAGAEREVGEVLAASGSEAELALGIQPTDGDEVMVLAGETVVDPRWPAGLIGAGALGALVLVALRRRRGATHEPETAVASVAIEQDRRSAAEKVPADQLADGGVHHQLGVIGAWARTLDDRWGALSENERRIASQIIRRTADEALRQLDPLPT